MSSPSLFDELQSQHCDIHPEEGLPRLQRTYQCRCGSAIFFRNSFCLNCRSALGYEPYLGKVVPIDPASDPETWTIGTPVGGAAALYWRCANVKTAAACNWLIPLSGVDNPQPFCKCCRLNRTIPDLSIPENKSLWASIEMAKRRVISALIALRLPTESRVTEDTERGLAFDLLRSVDSSHRVLTGHDDGLITLNIEEADDAKREQIRKRMREPYRTLVGHLRHEVGHYYWDRLIAATPNLNAYRELFGDERADYEQALKKNYEQGPQPNWRSLFVSSYASVHPWEDWAETWAHYMHMLDTLSTASSVGLRADSVELSVDPFTSAALYQDGVDKECFLSLLNSWVKLTAVMNELSRSMGQPDFYPFALPYATVAKLHFIHSVIRGDHK